MTRPAAHRLRWTAALLLTALLAACEREQRALRLDPPVSAALERAASMPSGVSGAPPAVYFKLGKPYAGNAWQLNQGKRLYAQFNCQGCHGNGGGASGPALIDGAWTWGPEIQSLFLSIRDGRPAGMPAFGNRLTTEQLWQLAGYVQKIGAYTPRPEAPGRNDEMHSRPAENRVPAALPPLQRPGHQ